MSRVFFFVIFVVAVILVFGLAQILLLRHLNRVWWDKRWIRRLAWSLPIVGIVFFILAVLGEYYRASWLAYSAAPISALAVIAEISLMLSLPISGLIHLIDRLITRFFRRGSSRQETPADPHRRLLLKGAAAAVPLATIATGFSGVGRAFGPVYIEHKQFRFNNLPPALEGLRILHLSDLHLRHYVTLSDLEEVMVEAEQLSPDLVLVTGDVADDLNQLPDALKMIAALKPRLGAFACLGNHEYFRGLLRVRREFDRSDVQLFIDKGVRLPVGDSHLFVGGIDDPVAMHNVSGEFFVNSLGNTLLAQDTHTGDRSDSSGAPFSSAPSPRSISGGTIIEATASCILRVAWATGSPSDWAAPPRHRSSNCIAPRSSRHHFGLFPL
jgi:hypothetical protein